MTIDTDAPGAGDLMFVLIMLAPVAVASLGAVWLLGATFARGSLGRWPRLLVSSPEQYRWLRAWVTFVPVLGPLTYGVAWCIGRAQLDPLRRTHVRMPFVPRGLSTTSRSTPLRYPQGPPSGPWVTTPDGWPVYSAQRPIAPIARGSWAVPDHSRSAQDPPHGWPPR